MPAPVEFEVKNFDKFQHYKDRNPVWIKLYNELLDDYEFGRLPDASKMHLIAIWLLASRSNNRIPYDAKWIAARINATERVNLEILENAGFISKINMVQNASNPLAEPYQNAIPEKEREEEKRREDIYDRDAEFDEFYAVYPRKVGKGHARKAYRAALAKADHAALVAAATRFALDPMRKPEFTPHPATWLNAERWLDVPEAMPPPRPTGPRPGSLQPG